MRDEIPKEQMEIPQSPSEVEYRTKRDLEVAIENADRIQRRLQKLDLTIQLSDLPSDVEEAIIVLLSGFSGTGGKA